MFNIFCWYPENFQKYGKQQGLVVAILLSRAQVSCWIYLPLLQTSVHASEWYGYICICVRAWVTVDSVESLEWQGLGACPSWPGLHVLAGLAWSWVLKMDLAVGLTLLCSLKIELCWGAACQDGVSGISWYGCVEEASTCFSAATLATFSSELSPVDFSAFSISTCRHDSCMLFNFISMKELVSRRCRIYHEAQGHLLVPLGCWLDRVLMEEVCHQRVCSHEGLFSIKMNLAPPLHSGPFQNFVPGVYLNRHLKKEEEEKS